MLSLKPDLTGSFLVDLKAKKKAVYRAPQLTRYGDLRSLTQGGTRGNPELLMCGFIKTLRC
jgi:hypothetical protein